VVVLDRGNCAFTKKALHAQNAGADAVIIVDNVNEDLVTMDASSDDASVAEAQNITVPVGLVTKATGDLFEPILEQRRTILVTLNWTDVLPHPDARVEWELWSNSGDNCGAKCDAQKGFVRDFASAAKTLEQGGYTQFTPHYVTWLCPPEAVHEDFCVKQCINNGRYCCPRPGRRLRRRVLRRGRRGAEPAYAVCVPRSQQHGATLEVVGLRHRVREQVHDGARYV
jgi:hypothetical protein